MTRLQALVVAGAVALAILALGSAYAFGRAPSYSSSAAVVLTPRPDISADELPTLVTSFASSATLGTYVELIRSSDTLRLAGSPPVSVEARAIPSSRVIDVRTIGRSTAVRPALLSVLRAARISQRGLHDVWQLEVLESPGPAAASGPRRTVIVALSAVLAAFGVVLLFGVLRHLGLLAEPLIGPTARRFEDPDAPLGSEPGRGARRPARVRTIR